MFRPQSDLCIAWKCQMCQPLWVGWSVYTQGLFPTVKRRTCIHVLRHYSRNSYYNFGRHAISQSPAGHAWETPDKKALQTTIEPTRLVAFCLIPLSNICSLVRPNRNVNREISLHCQEGFCVGKFGRVVDQAVLDNRPLRKHFRRSRLRY